METTINPYNDPYIDMSLLEILEREKMELARIRVYKKCIDDFGKELADDSISEVRKEYCNHYIAQNTDYINDAIKNLLKARSDLRKYLSHNHMFPIMDPEF